MPATHSAQWRGYGHHEVHRGTFTASTVVAIEFAETAGVVIVENFDESNDVYVVLSDKASAGDVTDPDDGGAGDTDNEMIRVGAGKLELRRATKIVKVVSGGTGDWQVVGLY